MKFYVIDRPHIGTHWRKSEPTYARIVIVRAICVLAIVTLIE